jgi:hypothetical protein
MVCGIGIQSRKLPCWFEGIRLSCLSGRVRDSVLEEKEPLAFPFVYISVSLYIFRLCIFSVFYIFGFLYFKDQP